ncbi:hypothetical protein LY76DRAFT_606418 [Colletotrichum caudatum]|nr:hypothetical protein LY76DRAFT_606418 [Colletotrichum caudatum]
MATEYSNNGMLEHLAYPGKAGSMFNVMRYTPQDVEVAEILAGMRTSGWDKPDSRPPSSSQTSPDAHTSPSPTISASSSSATAKEETATKTRILVKQNRGTAKGPRTPNPKSRPSSRKSKKVSCPCSREKCKEGIKVAPSTMDGHLRADMIKQKGQLLDPPCSACANSNQPCYKWTYASCENCSRRKETCPLNDKKTADGKSRRAKEQQEVSNWEGTAFSS